jgi:hypothetical protein
VDRKFCLTDDTDRLLSPLKTPNSSGGKASFSVEVLRSLVGWTATLLIISFATAGSEVVDDPDDNLAKIAGSDIANSLTDCACPFASAGAVIESPYICNSSPS